MKILTVVLAICMLSVIGCSNDNDAEISELKNQIKELQQAQAVSQTATSTPMAVATSTPMAVATSMPTFIPMLIPISFIEQSLTVEVGDKVTVHYHGTLESGDVFDSSREREPLSFVVGAGSMIKGFDEAVKGLQIDDIVTVKLSPEDAYGVKDESLIFEVSSEGAPSGLNIGDRVQLQGGIGATVVSISDSKIHLDANHELAGVPLIFEIEVISIERN